MRRRARSYLTQTPGLIIWTDASWEHGGDMIGIVIYDSSSDRFSYSFAVIPQWLIDIWEILNRATSRR